MGWVDTCRGHRPDPGPFEPPDRPQHPGHRERPRVRARTPRDTVALAWFLGGLVLVLAGWPVVARLLGADPDPVVRTSLVAVTGSLLTVVAAGVTLRAAASRSGRNRLAWGSIGVGTFLLAVGTLGAVLSGATPLGEVAATGNNALAVRRARVLHRRRRGGPLGPAPHRGVPDRRPPGRHGGSVTHVARPPAVGTGHDQRAGPGAGAGPLGRPGRGPHPGRRRDAGPLRARPAPRAPAPGPGPAPLPGLGLHGTGRKHRVPGGALGPHRPAVVDHRAGAVVRGRAPGLDAVAGTGGGPGAGGTGPRPPPRGRRPGHAGRGGPPPTGDDLGGPGHDGHRGDRGAAGRGPGQPAAGRAGRPDGRARRSGGRAGRPGPHRRADRTRQPAGPGAAPGRRARPGPGRRGVGVLHRPGQLQERQRRAGPRRRRPPPGGAGAAPDRRAGLRRLPDRRGRVHRRPRGPGPRPGRGGGVGPGGRAVAARAHRRTPGGRRGQHRPGPVHPPQRRGRGPAPRRRPRPAAAGRPGPLPGQGTGSWPLGQLRQLAPGARRPPAPAAAGTAPCAGAGRVRGPLPAHRGARDASGGGRRGAGPLELTGVRPAAAGGVPAHRGGGRACCPPSGAPSWS